MGVGSYQAQFNKVQILRMNEARGITLELEINEPWPQSKILWLPRQDDLGPEAGPDLLATSSDILRLYRLHVNDETGCYEQNGEPVSLINRSEFCQPITSFDWNQFDPSTIASASLDSSVTIWNIE